jgi:hypothetical protein
MLVGGFSVFRCSGFVAVHVNTLRYAELPPVWDVSNLEIGKEYLSDGCSLTCRVSITFASTSDRTPRVREDYISSQYKKVFLSTPRLYPHPSFSLTPAHFRFATSTFLLAYTMKAPRFKARRSNFSLQDPEDEIMESKTTSIKSSNSSCSLPDTEDDIMESKVTPVAIDENAATTNSLQELQSADQRKVMDIVDKLRRTGLSSIVELPQLVVCGDQSSGKSSVLEAITEIPFPRKENLCTRFATEVCFYSPSSCSNRD